MLSGVVKVINDIPHILKREKKFISCEWLEHGIIFDHAKHIRICCEQSHQGKGRYVLDDSFNGLWLDINKIIEIKQKFRKEIREGKIPEFCSGCMFLKEDYWDDEVSFSSVLLTHWSRCNTRCVYCPAVRDGNLTDDEHYNILPILRQLFDAKLISNNAKFSIAGGESTIYPEFDKLLYFLTDSGIKNINVNSSGIKYSASIAELIANNLAEIVISLDCSSKKIYKLIKETDTFDVVVGNIKRYLEAEQINEKRVIVKYILIKGINDSSKDVLDWFIFCKELGVKKLALDIDIAFYEEIKDNVPKYLKEIVVFAKEISKLNSIPLDLYDRANMIHKSLKS